MSETTSATPSKNGAIFNHADLVTMSVYYMIPEHLDVEELKENTKTIEEQVSESDTLLNQDETIVEFLKDFQRCKIYGTCEQFIQELTAFQNFPASHKYFPLKFTTPYYTTPVLYKSVKGERFMCKQDFHTILQYLVQDTVPASKNHVISSLISIYLKSKEDVGSEKMKFRKFQISEFEAIRKDLQTTNYTHFDESQTLKSTFFNEEVLEKLRQDFLKIQENREDSAENSISGKFLKLIPTTTWSREESQWIENALENERIEAAGNSKSPNFYTEILVCLYTNATLILKKMGKILQKWAELNEETTVIRVFEDGQQNSRFLLKNELFEALKIEKIGDFKDFDNSKFLKNPLKIRKINPKSKTKNLLTPPPVTDGAYGLLYEEAMKKYTLQTAEFDFVRFPIERTVRRAIPMLGPPSTKCGHAHFYIPTVDGFLEILKSLIWGSKIFQKFEFEKKKVVYEVFADFAVVFDVQQTTPTLIRTARIRELTNIYTKKFTFHQKLDFHPFRDPPKDQEITPEDLKFELENLSLLDFFPKIQDSAEKVLEALLVKTGPENAENYRKSSGIWFDAIESCQMICIMEIFPKLKAFLHSQKSCRRISGLNCESCEEFPSENVRPSVKNPEFSGDSTEKFPDILGCRIGPRNLTKFTGCSDFKIPEYVADFEDIKNPEDVKICEDEKGEDVKDSESKDLEDVESPEVLENPEDGKEEQNRLEEQKEQDELKTLQDLQNRVENLGIAIENQMTCQEEFDGFVRESSRNAKKAEAKIKRLEKELSREQEKNQKLKKKNLEFLDFAHENSQLKKRIFEMEEAEQRVMEEHQNEIASLTRKIADRNSKIESLERELKRNQDRNEALKNIFATNSHLNEENERLKMKVSGCETREARITEAYEKMKKSFQEDRVKFSERIAEMARSLRCEKIKTSDVEATAAQLRRQLKNMEDSDRIAEIQDLKEDIQEKRRYIQLILDTNSQLNAEMDKNRRKFRKISEILGSDDFSSSTSNFVESAAKKGRNLNFGENFSLQSPPIPHILPIGAERSSSSSRRLNSFANTPSTSSTVFLYSPPPELTSSSSEATTSSSSPVLLLEPSDLADSECVICLSEVRSTDKIIKCHECRRRFHGKCASDWLKVKSICPTCKGKLLDPEEFPAL